MSLLFSLAIFIFVLGVLIFFHELGHFLAAKACGIYVDRFSLGMPPRIAGIRLGETDYCLGALPIGGYVKMAGQEDAPMSEEERTQDYGHVPEDRWFNKKPVWQRAIVVLAGPLMNLVLAVLLYGWLAALGPEVPEWETDARIGQVRDDLPAATAPLYRVPENGAAPDTTGQPDAIGWKTGDRVLEINGKSAQAFTDIMLEALLGGENTVNRVLIERVEADGAAARYISIISPRIPEGEENPLFGVGHFATPIVRTVLEDMPAALSSLEEGDVIVRANGNLVDQTSFIALVEDTPEGESIALEIDRDGQRLDLTIVPETIGRARGLVYGPGATNGGDGPVQVLAVTDEFQEKTGIQRKDVVLRVNGAPVTYAQFEEMVRERPGETLELTLQRPAILLGLLQRSGEMNVELPIDAVRAIGVTFSPRMVVRDIPPSQIVPEAFRQSYQALALVMRTLKALAARDVSPSNLGGPIMIASATSRAAEEGLDWLLRITAFISINLCVFNLLPLPVLDGGLLLMTVIEGVRRRPLSVKLQERFQMAGFFLIIFLMVFVTYHDLRRWVESLIP